MTRNVILLRKISLFQENFSCFEKNFGIQVRTSHEKGKEIFLVRSTFLLKKFYDPKPIGNKISSKMDHAWKLNLLPGTDNILLLSPRKNYVHI